jgi:threonine dehydratase
MPVTLSTIRAAARRISDGVFLSPCPESVALSELTKAHVHCKFDNMQRTGSFKERGARNALKQLPTVQRRRGVIAASAGNHALGLAYHGSNLGIPVTVVMPVHAPLIKVTTCRRLGANVVLHGQNFAEAVQEATRRAEAHGFAYIHGFDDEHIIAGQGTMALEILKQVPQVDAIVAPIGGAGLIAGMAVAAKALRPEVEIIGVESSATGSYQAAIKNGGPIFVPPKPTLADGLAVTRVGDQAFSLARPLVDRVITVSEKWIALAILRYVELEKTVVEGAAAAPLGALLAGKLKHLAGKRIVLAVCGGNIDPAVLSRVIEKGLVADGRLCRFTVEISDRPGGLAALSRTIAAAGASIKDIEHDRAFSGPDVSAVHAVCTVETRDHAHVRALQRALKKDGFPFVSA